MLLWPTDVSPIILEGIKYQSLIITIKPSWTIIMLKLKIVCASKISCNEKIDFVKRIKSIYICQNLILIVLQHTYSGNKLVAFFSSSGFGIRNEGVGLLNKDFLNKCSEQFTTSMAQYFNLLIRFGLRFVAQLHRRLFRKYL